MTDVKNEAQETLQFQSEVQQLLHIVINSLYTDREIFLRELISNAVDALEKMRYQSITQNDIYQNDLPLQIKIQVDETAKTLTVTDTGIGMNKDELIENIGTIAHSGSKAFFQQLAEAEQKDVNLIGQFGVGFYASFMVAQSVRVLTRSFRPEDQGYQWTSDGLGSYTISPAQDLPRGTSIILQLKEDAEQYASLAYIKGIIQKYSNFIPFPIILGDETVNTIEAVWAKNKNEVTPEEYEGFYKFIANAWDSPHYQLHFTVDAPIALNALLFVPGENMERFGFGKMESGVSLYCRKVLVQSKAEGLLPEWLRFLKGVVDSEDIPINISRETMQDSTLVAKLRRVITSRFIKFLAEKAKEDGAGYGEFWRKFGIFIKEGAASDFTYNKDLAPLLRFGSSKAEPDQLVSLDDYVARLGEDEKHIYYINGPSRTMIESGPYLEAFKLREIEVLYTFEPVDDFVLTNLGEYKGKKLISADQADVELPPLEDETEKATESEDELSGLDVRNLTAWMKQQLGDKVKEVRESKRLVDSPAMLIQLEGSMTGSMQRVMQAVNQDFALTGDGALEINTKHPLILNLDTWRQKDEEFAKLALEQIFDNALIAAGLITDPRPMVDRMYRILEQAMKVSG